MIKVLLGKDGKITASGLTPGETLLIIDEERNQQVRIGRFGSCWSRKEAIGGKDGGGN